MISTMAAFSTPYSGIPPPFRVLVDDEAEAEDNALNLTFQKPLLQDRDNPFNIPEDMFCTLFKLTKDMVRAVIDSVRLWSITQDDLNVDLPLERQVLTTLMVYANGEYESWSGGLEASLDEASAKAVVKRVTMGISASMLHSRLIFPSSQESRAAAKEAFSRSGHPFPGAIGCMDGFQVKIARPDTQPEVFWNFLNRSYTLNVQLVCGPDMRITYVNPRYPGLIHDNIIWQESTVFKNMSAGFAAGERDTWLLADGNYALQPWLMTPIAPSLVDPNTPEERYNKAHAKAMSLVEKCIRTLRGTWRVLSLNKTMDYEAVLCANIVNACCVLHNMRCAGNAPLIMDPPKKKSRPAKKRRVEDNAGPPRMIAPQNEEQARALESARLEEQTAALQQHIAPREPSGNAPREISVHIIGFDNAEEHLKVESSRLEEQIAALQAQEPRRVLGNQAAAWNILANKAALVEDPNAIVFDAKVAGRRTELDLARRLQARVVAQHFSN